MTWIRRSGDKKATNAFESPTKLPTRSAAAGDADRLTESFSAPTIQTGADGSSKQPLLRSFRNERSHRRGIGAATMAGWAMLAVAIATPLAAAETDPAVLFGKHCTGCHTYGKGVKVGPDLKGVTDRRSRPWLMRFIRSSRTMIQSQEPVAVQLFQQYNKQQMPDWSQLSQRDIEHLLEFFAGGGPERISPDQRDAAHATAAEINKGRRLFSGQLSFQYITFACNSCHSVQDDHELTGGSLGPDLTTSYLQYQDKALTSFLRQPCFPAAAGVATDKYLTPEEVFALKAYLRHAASQHESMVAETGKSGRPGQDEQAANGAQTSTREK